MEGMQEEEKQIYVIKQRVAIGEVRFIMCFMHIYLSVQSLREEDG